MKFQSTPSARRATCCQLAPLFAPCYFNPRPPRGGRPSVVSERLTPVSYFNPRPPRGGRQACSTSLLAFSQFQSTPSARRATHGRFQRRGDCIISIHALREEGDAKIQVLRSDYLHFNPRPPRGGRLSPLPASATAFAFQSTPSARRATRPFAASPPPVQNFNPRPPRGGRRWPRSAFQRPSEFQSTPSARRATRP